MKDKRAMKILKDWLDSPSDKMQWEEEYKALIHLLSRHNEMTEDLKMTWYENDMLFIRCKRWQERKFCSFSKTSPCFEGSYGGQWERKCINCGKEIKGGDW